MRGLLSGFRVLDLADEKGMFCGRLLADLGADVIKIEPPGGDPARCIGPFYHDIPDPEKSLFWFAYNRNKRGITLNIATPDGKEIFRKLIERSDCVIESFSPGYMDRLGLGYSALSEINRGIIMTSITPFGETGPYKDYKAADIVAMAMGGLMYRLGDSDRPPVPIATHQSYLNASADAAVGTMIAYYHRESTGEGQWVDGSAQQSITVDLLNIVPTWESMGENLQRYGPYRSGYGGEAKARLIVRCKDGFVNFAIYGGAPWAATNRAMEAWLDSEGILPDFMRGMEWGKLDGTTVTQEMQEQLEEPPAKLFATHTKAEIFEEARKRRIMLYPVSTCKDLLQNEQLQARGFWQEVEHPELGSSITYPGAFFQASETPCWIGRRAPLIGEHNIEIYEEELGFSREDLLLLKQARVI